MQIENFYSHHPLVFVKCWLNFYRPNEG
jgi:hypothetical protein